MGGIGIISNPKARHNRLFPREKTRLAYVLGDSGTYRETATPAQLEEVARDFKRRKIDILGLNGGDGTNHHTLSAFIRVYGEQPLPAIAFLKGGTMNCTAAACGVHGGPASILKNLVDKYHRGVPFEMVERRTIKVGEDQYGFIFGTGVVLKFIKLYNAEEDRGPLRAANLLVRTAFSAMVGGRLARHLARPVRLLLTVDGQQWEPQSYTAVGMSTLHYVGLGFAPFQRAYESADTFHLLGLHGRPRQLALELPRVLMGKGFSEQIADNVLASQVVLESDTPIDYIVDGDVYRSKGTLRLQLGPMLRVVVK